MGSDRCADHRRACWSQGPRLSPASCCQPMKNASGRSERGSGVPGVERRYLPPLWSRGVPRDQIPSRGQKLRDPRTQERKQPSGLRPRTWAGESPERGRRSEVVGAGGHLLEKHLRLKRSGVAECDRQGHSRLALRGGRTKCAHEKECEPSAHGEEITVGD